MGASSVPGRGVRVPGSSSVAGSLLPDEASETATAGPQGP
jgi:hypothetical protein